MNALPLIAQFPHFLQFTSEDGLAQNQIHEIIQDGSGNIWAGTNGAGISKFNGYEFINYSTQDNLVNGAIWAMIFDKNGLMWIATDAGVSTFNGKSFSTMNFDGELSNKMVYGLLEDLQGNVWFGTQENLYRYSADNRKANHMVLDTMTFLLKEFQGDIRKIIEDKKGNVWVGTLTSGAYKLEPQSNGQYIIQKYDQSNGTCNNHISTLYEDSDGVIWFGSWVGGLSFLKNDVISCLDSSELVQNRISRIVEDHLGNLFLTTFGTGILKLDKSDKNLPAGKFETYSINNGLNTKQFETVFQDSQLNLWFGSIGNGLFFLQEKGYRKYDDKSGLNGSFIWSVSVDNQNRIWSGSNSAGLSIINDQEKYSPEKYLTVNNYNGLPDNEVLSVMQDVEDFMWIGTGKGAVKGKLNKGSFQSIKTYNTKGGLPDDLVKCIFQSQDRNVYIGTQKGLLVISNKGKSKTIYNTQSGLVNNYIYHVTEGKKGEIIISTNGGVSILKDSTITNINHTNGFLHNDVRTCVVDNQGNYWFATGGGICYVNSENFKSVNYNMKEGLKSNRLYFLFQEEKGRIWCGSDMGLDYFYPDSVSDSRPLKFSHATDLTGFPEIETNTNAIASDSNGRLWIGTVNGLYNFNPEFVSSNGNMEVPLRIIAVQNGNEFLNIHEQTLLPHHKNSLSFSYSGVLFPSARNVRYKYRLLGLDDNWSDVTKERKVTFSNLSAGDYVFEVIADNGDDLWSKEPRDFAFTVKAAFWQTIWFMVFAITLGFLLIYLIYTARIKSLGKKQEVLEALIKERTQEIQLKNLKLEKLESAIKGTNNSIVITDPLGNLQWVNEAFNRVTGFSLEEFKTERGATLLESSAEPRIKEIIQECIESRTPKVYESKNLTKEGKALWMQTTLTPILENEVLQHLVAIDSDISDRKEMEDQINEKNRSILDSIRYAKRIQKSLLPTNEQINEMLSESFVLYKPKDIVSGDFYFFSQVTTTDKSKTEQEKLVLIAAADCTGHGVPGAFMSFVGHNFLKISLKKKDINSPASALDFLNQGVNETVGNRSGEDLVLDGMDIALIAYDPNSLKLQYAGAKNPLYVVRNGELMVTKGDIQSIGAPVGKELRRFTNHVFQMQKGDMVYVFSDGYADQFGGPKGKKFRYKPLQEFLISIAEKSCDQQLQKLDTEFESWKGDYDQIDDVLVLGFRV